MSAHAIFDLIEAFCGNSIIPYLQGSLKVVRMNGFSPSWTFGLFIGLTAKFPQGGHILFNFSVSISNPSNLTCRVNIRPIACFACQHRFLYPFAFGDVSYIALDDFALIYKINVADELHIDRLAIDSF